MQHVWVNANGLFFPENALPVAAADVGLRYGVSLFETLRWTGQNAPLLEGHYKRLVAGLSVFGVPLPAFFTLHFLQTEIQNTVKQNAIVGAARIRIQVTPHFAESALAVPPALRYRIECYACNPLIFNRLGVNIGFSRSHYQAVPTPFCAFKTGNYAPYFLASREAKGRGLDDIFLLNADGRIGESATANVFWTESNRLFTPPLSEGIVAGVARGHLLQVLFQSGFPVEEHPLSKARLFKADSLFLTNAFRGLQWVATCEGKAFKKGPAESLFKKAFAALA